MNTDDNAIGFPKLDPYNLSFRGNNEVLEKSFQENYFTESLKQLRLCIILSITVYAFFGIVDIKAVPHLKNIFWIIRYVFYCPMAISLLVFTYSKYFIKYFQLTVAMSAILASVGLIIVNSLASSSGFYSYRYAIVFSLIFIYDLTRLRFINASVTGWTVIILYNCSALYYKNIPSQIYFDSNILFLFISIFGMVSCYFMESYEKKNYYLITLLNSEKKKVEDINQELEKKVLERTSQLEKTNVDLIYLSYHDKLTGLYNRRFYEEEINKLDIESNLPISIVIGDVNGLKLVNDAFGHDKGDKILQEAAEAIQSICRKDDLVARWGGDEFILLLPKTKTEEVEEIVNRIKNSYSNIYVNAIHVSISFGWDTKESPDEDIKKVMKSAEDLMYKYKIIENEGMRSNTINTIIKTLHEKNPREEQHSKRVSEICQNIGKAMGLSEIEVSKLKMVGLLHDIGKIAIEEAILNKPGKLTEQEWNEIKRHPDIGYRILSSSYEMLELADYILAHHERWDGSGYPKGLKGDEIPKFARIISLADAYDAMTSERPYRNALNDDEVFTEIRKNAGIQFDPVIAKIFIEKVLCKRWDP